MLVCEHMNVKKASGIHNKVKNENRVSLSLSFSLQKLLFRCSSHVELYKAIISPILLYVNLVIVEICNVSKKK